MDRNDNGTGGGGSGVGGGGGGGIGGNSGSPLNSSSPHGPVFNSNSGVDSQVYTVLYVYMIRGCSRYTYAPRGSS